MRTESLRTRAAGFDQPSYPPPPSAPDAAFAARPLLVRLQDDLVAARKVVARRHPSDAPVFFFDPARQSEYEAAGEDLPVAPVVLAGVVAERIAELSRSVEVRRVARAVPGLREAAVGLAGVFGFAKDLADLLAVPDDETVLVLHPESRTGYRLLVRGVADIGQFHLLLPDAVSDLGPPSPAGESAVAEARYQMFKPEAVRPDGSVPAVFAGCDHWLWPQNPLATVPRVEGERVVVLGEPAYRVTWEVERRFPAMTAEVILLRSLDRAEVGERLGRLTGRPVPAARGREYEPARAA